MNKVQKPNVFVFFFCMYEVYMFVPLSVTLPFLFSACMHVRIFFVYFFSRWFLYYALSYCERPILNLLSLLSSIVTSSCSPSCISRSLSSCLWFFVYFFISFCSLSSLLPFFSHSFLMFFLLIFLFPFVKTFSYFFFLACLSSPLLPLRLWYFYSNLLMFCVHTLVMLRIIATLIIAMLRLR